MISCVFLNKEWLRRRLHFMEKERKIIWILASLREMQEDKRSYALLKLNPENPSGSVARAILPELRSSNLSEQALAVSGSSLFVLGGKCRRRCSDCKRYNFSSWHGHKNVYTVHYSRGRSSIWMEGPPMLYARASPACVVVDGKIYVFGGLDYLHNQRKVPFGEVFDPTTDKWEALPQMPADHELNFAKGVFVAACTMACGGSRKRCILVHLGESYRLMRYCLEDRSWFCVEPNFRWRSRNMVVVDDVIYSMIPGAEYIPMGAYHLSTRQYLTVHSDLELEPCGYADLIYVGNNEFLLFSGYESECRFLKFAVRKNCRGTKLDSISITKESSGEFFLGAEFFLDHGYGIVAAQA